MHRYLINLKIADSKRALNSTPNDDNEDDDTSTEGHTMEKSGASTLCKTILFYFSRDLLIRLLSIKCANVCEHDADPNSEGIREKKKTKKGNFET